MSKLISAEMPLVDMMTLLKLHRGEFFVVEGKIHPASRDTGKRLANLNIPPDCVIAAIIRKGQMMIPHGNTVLNPADEILADEFIKRSIKFPGWFGQAA